MIFLEGSFVLGDTLYQCYPGKMGKVDKEVQKRLKELREKRGAQGASGSGALPTKWPRISTQRQKEMAGAGQSQKRQASETTHPEKIDQSNKVLSGSSGEEYLHSTMEGRLEINKGTTKPALSNSLLQWCQWQLLDSILPTGGFAHSFGLEAAVQACVVSGPEDLRTHVIHVLENTGSLLLPFVYSAAVSPTMQIWHKLDKMLDATLANEVSRKASIAQGSALMRVAAAVFSEIPNLKIMRESSLAAGVSFHHAPIFGLVCGLLGFDSETSQRAYIFMAMRDIISAATRLNLVGPLGAAVLQHQIALVAEDVVNRWMNREVEDACQVAPLLDTVQGCHGYLFSRLFCS